MDKNNSNWRPLTETSSAYVGSTPRTGLANGDDWQEEVYQKIKTMKEKYLPELLEMYQKIAAKLQELDSLPQQPKSEQLDKLKLFENTLERAIQFLQVPKGSILLGYKEKLAHYEKQIISFINTNRPRKPVSQLQQGQHPPSSHMHSMQQPQSQINQVQPHENQMNPQLQSMNVLSSVGTMQQNNMTSLQQNLCLLFLEFQQHSNYYHRFNHCHHICRNSLVCNNNPLQRDIPQRFQASGQTPEYLLQTHNVIDEQKQLYQSQRALPETSSSSMDSTARTGRARGADWQEEIYQEIKTMNELYLPELLDMYQKIAGKLQELDSLPQQPKSEQLDKLKLFKNTLERAIQFLQLSKGNILPEFKEKLPHYEKQIVSFINTNRPGKPVFQLQQGQHPPSI